jgi:hypothetical protein
MSDETPVGIMDEKLMKFTIVVKMDNIDEVNAVLQTVRDKKLCESFRSVPIWKHDNEGHIRCMCTKNEYIFRPGECLKTCDGSGWLDPPKESYRRACYQLSDDGTRQRLIPWSKSLWRRVK